MGKLGSSQVNFFCQDSTWINKFIPRDAKIQCLGKKKMTWELPSLPPTNASPHFICMKITNHSHSNRLMCPVFFEGFEPRAIASQSIIDSSCELQSSKSPLCHRLGTFLQVTPLFPCLPKPHPPAAGILRKILRVIQIITKMGGNFNKRCKTTG